MLTEKHTRNISGLITKIESAFMSDISLLEYFAVNNSASITFVEGKSFSEDYFSPKSARLNSKTDETQHGDVFSFELSYKTAGLDASNTIKLAKATGKRICLRITDNNGSRIILPYAKVLFTPNIGEQQGNHTGLTITITSVLPHPAPMDQSLGTSIPII
jgi:hypothetical protein